MKMPLSSLALNDPYWRINTSPPSRKLLKRGKYDGEFRVSNKKFKEESNDLIDQMVKGKQEKISN